MFVLLYKVIIIIHVLTAIIGLGHTFFFPLFFKMPKNREQMTYVVEITSILGKIAKKSDYTLLISGFLLIAMNNTWFSIGWINLSLILFIFMRFSSGKLSKKTSSELRNFMKNSLDYNGKEVDLLKEYENKLNEYMPKLILTQSITLLIMILMILKPNIDFLSLLF